MSKNIKTKHPVLDNINILNVFDTVVLAFIV
jgi:hypothetical protein